VTVIWNIKLPLDAEEECVWPVLSTEACCERYARPGGCRQLGGQPPGRTM